MFIVETRERQYPFRQDANSFVDSSSGMRKTVLRDDPGGKGWEIVKEVQACQACADGV